MCGKREGDLRLGHGGRATAPCDWAVAGAAVNRDVLAYTAVTSSSAVQTRWFLFLPQVCGIDQGLARFSSALARRWALEPLHSATVAQKQPKAESGPDPQGLGTDDPRTAHHAGEEAEAQRS